MNNYPEILVCLLWRSLVAAPFFCICISGRAGFFTPLFGIAGAIIVAFPVARLLAEPCGNLFLPEKHLAQPPPIYSMPQSKRAKGLYEEAIAELEIIAKNYPEEVQPYIEMVDIAIVNLHDPDRASVIYQRGISLLKDEKDKAVLEGMYGAICTRLDARPNTQPPA
jgi:hypothetical protein